MIPLQLATLYREHRSIAAVLKTFDYLVQSMKRDGELVSPQVFRAILYYLDVFPERHHHPKEEALLFPVIRARTHDADVILDELRRQHERGEAAIRDLEQLLLRYEAGGDAERMAFVAGAEAFVRGYWEHMRLEEDQLMPVALKVLTDQDWRQIEAAFAQHQDPIEGAEGALSPEDLIQKILHLAPAPIGYGPASQKT